MQELFAALYPTFLITENSGTNWKEIKDNMCLGLFRSLDTFILPTNPFPA